MKFTMEASHGCGGKISFSAYGEGDWAGATCKNCGMAAFQMDPLSVSVTAERLLYRSKAELDSGDYSLSIVIGTMAVESFLTRMFFKAKGMDNYAKTFTWPTEEQEAEWEAEYPKKGGFIIPADFVAKSSTGMTFDEFAAKNAVASKIFAGLPGSSNASPKKYFQSELFRLRNRIAHWGYVNTTNEEAQCCHTLAVAIVSILREMDRLKYESL